MKKRRWQHEEVQQWLRDNKKTWYCNKEDANIFIRKQFAWAWTFNWGNPWVYIIIVGTIGVLVGMQWWI